MASSLTIKRFFLEIRRYFPIHAGIQTITYTIKTRIKAGIKILAISSNSLVFMSSTYFFHDRFAIFQVKIFYFYRIERIPKKSTTVSLGLMRVFVVWILFFG